MSISWNEHTSFTGRSYEVTGGIRHAVWLPNSPSFCIYTQRAHNKACIILFGYRMAVLLVLPAFPVNAIRNLQNPASLAQIRQYRFECDRHFDYIRDLLEEFPDNFSPRHMVALGVFSNEPTGYMATNALEQSYSRLRAMGVPLRHNFQQNPVVLDSWDESFTPPSVFVYQRNRENLVYVDDQLVHRSFGQ